LQQPGTGGGERQEQDDDRQQQEENGAAACRGHLRRRQPLAVRTKPTLTGRARPGFARMGWIDPSRGPHPGATALSLLAHAVRKTAARLDERRGPLARAALRN